MQERCFLRASWPATDSLDRACAVLVCQEDSQPCCATLLPSDSSLPPSREVHRMGLSLSPLCQSDEEDPPTLVTSPTGCLEAEIPKSLHSDFTGEISHQVTQAGEVSSPATSGFIQTEKGSEGNGCVYCRQPRKGMCRKWTMGQPLTQQRLGPHFIRFTV